jgi:hypothetical protein
MQGAIRGTSCMCFHTCSSGAATSNSFSTSVAHSPICGVRTCDSRLRPLFYGFLIVMTLRGHHHERALIDPSGLEIKFADDVLRRRMTLRGTTVWSP